MLSFHLSRIKTLSTLTKSKKKTVPSLRNFYNNPIDTVKSNFEMERFTSFSCRCNNGQGLSIAVTI